MPLSLVKRFSEGKASPLLGFLSSRDFSKTAQTIFCPLPVVCAILSQEFLKETQKVCRIF
jgi:hypothetical protein